MIEPKIERPDDSVLIHEGVKVGVWFTGECDGRGCVIMPLCGGFYAAKSLRTRYSKAAKVVTQRLRELGYVVDG